MIPERFKDVVAVISKVLTAANDRLMVLLAVVFVKLSIPLYKTCRELGKVTRSLPVDAGKGSLMTKRIVLEDKVDEMVGTAVSPVLMNEGIAMRVFVW